MCRHIHARTHTHTKSQNTQWKVNNKAYCDSIDIFSVKTLKRSYLHKKSLLMCIMYKEVFSSWIYHSDHSDKFSSCPNCIFPIWWFVSVCVCVSLCVWERERERIDWRDFWKFFFGIFRNRMIGYVWCHLKIELQNIILLFWKPNFSKCGSCCSVAQSCPTVQQQGLEHLLPMDCYKMWIYRTKNNKCLIICRTLLKI